MGATVSRSSPTMTGTLLVNIPEYSKLVRVPGEMQKVDQISFRGIKWDLKLQPQRVEEEQGVDLLVVAIRSENGELALGIDVSVEILDETGEHTVFNTEICRGTYEEEQGFLNLCVQRRELEASSCVHRPDDSITVRCTLKEQPKRPCRLFRSWSSFKSKEQLPEVVSEVPMAATHTLTVGSLSKLKAALLIRQRVYSTHFAVGGSRWYFSFCHTPAAMHLVRANKEDDVSRTTAEFSFTLEGAVNVESGKMMHTFDRDKPYCAFAYQPPEDLSSSSTDHLVVRCCIEVIPAAVPSEVIIPAAVQSPPQSVRTPLLSAMYG